MSKPPPPLLSLAIDAAILNFSTIYDLSFLPDHILLEIFWAIINPGSAMTSCAGSAGVSPPPNRRPYRIQGQCEDDDFEEEILPPPPPSKRKRGERGSSKGLIIAKLKQQLGGLIPLVWHPNFPVYDMPVSKYAPQFASHLGNVIRAHVPCCHETWEEVHEQYKYFMWQELQDSFTPLDDDVHYDAVMSHAGILYNRWKNRLNDAIRAHLRAKKPGHCPRPKIVSQEHWDTFLRIFYSEKFQKKSAQNKKNAQGHKYTSGNGRNSLGHIRFADLLALKLLEARQRIAPGDGPLLYPDDIRIFTEVFGVRRDFLVGLGLSRTRNRTTSNQHSTFNRDVSCKCVS